MRRRRATGCGNALVRRVPSQHADEPGLLLVMLPRLGNAVGVAREADLQQIDLLGRDREKLAQRRSLHRAARVLLHLQAVEKYLGDTVGRDYAAVPAQETATALPERLRHRVALFGGADM